MLTELLEACSPDAQGTDINKMKKMFHLHLLLCRVYQKAHTRLSPLFHPLLFPLCASCTFLDHQHGRPSAAWPAKEPISWWAPNQTTRGSVWHVAHNIHPLCWGWLGHWTMFWEHHKDAAQLLSLSACPFILPSLSLLVYSAPPSWVGASWACYPNPTVVAAFVSLTRGPALYTCQGANESNKQGPGKRGG